jgi:hypothetical protein
MMADGNDRRETPMARAKEKPGPARYADYRTDFQQWSVDQAGLLRSGNVHAIDLPNVIEELESMGREQEHALASSYRVLLMHLLKWAHQPARRTRSWSNTIGRERANIEDREDMNRSLAARAGELVDWAYPRAVRDASRETGLPKAAFPETCPYSLDQLRDPDFLPE